MGADIFVFFKTVTSDLKCLENFFFKDLGKLDIRNVFVNSKVSHLSTEN